jgi:hypothetical protein
MSLFPFLDTLVCTMGALILMLLAMTPKIKERALARQAAAMEAAAGSAVEPELDPETAAEPEPPAMAFSPAPPSTDEIAAERQRRRDAWLAQAADARNSLGARQSDYRVHRQKLQEAEQRLRELNDQILNARLKSENAGHAGEALEERVQRLEAQAAVVAQKIAETRKNIDLTNRRQAAAKNEYSLVAYDGTSGTTRRPIYIECTGHGFRFLPEDETISASDLEGFSDGFNPLLAGARTLVQFWARRKRTAGTAEPEPYVLLLVRPSGCFTYYVARKYLSSLGVNWGYELIEEDWKLSIPAADPLAKTLLKDTLAATLQIRRPNRDVAAGGRDYGGPFDPRELFDSDGTDGNPFGAGGNGESGFDKSGRAGGRTPSIKQGYATRNDRPSGDSFPGVRSARDVDIAGSRSGGKTGLGTDDGSAGATGTGRSAGGPVGSGGPGGKTQAAGIGGGNRRGTGRGGSTATGGDDEWQSPGGIAVAADGSAGSAAGKAATVSDRTSGGMGSGSSNRNSTGGQADGENGDGGENELAGRGNPTGGRGRTGRARPASLGGTSDLAGDDEEGDGDQSLSAGFISDDELLMNPGGAGAAGEGGLAGLQPGSRRATAGRNSGASGSAGADESSDGGQSNAEADPAATNAAGTPSKPSWLSDPDDGSASSSRSAQMGGPGLNVSLGGKKSRRKPNQENPDDGPRISENSDNKPSSGAAVRANGPRKWGQVGRKAGIGFEKKIKIYLNDKRVVVDNKQHMLLVTPADSGEEIINHVVASIDSVADSWGEPPSNFYWVPVVQFIVYPGGDANYARLHTALEQKWGVTSTVEYAADRKDKKAASGGRP